MASSPVVRERRDVPFSELTTLRLGGPGRLLLEASSEDELVEALGSGAGDPDPLVIAGGSNVVVSDEGFEGTVLRVVTRGISASRSGERILLEVAAGEPWDAVVERCVEDGLAGVECLSGIPGSTGATPIQNVGAYGQEVSSTIVSVRTFDRARRQVAELAGAQCGFAYRASALKRSSMKGRSWSSTGSSCIGRMRSDSTRKSS
jgi:UDP-N-acetylmuramate dehydrogenase